MTSAHLRSNPLVFVDDLDTPRLADDDRHHLTRSLRLRPGQAIVLGDGKGRLRTATLTPESEPADLGPITSSSQRANALTIGFALVKGDRPELIVRTLTELGIDRIVPMVTERSVVRWDESRVVKNLDRHRRVAREAAMQSRNSWLPEVWPACPLDQVIDRLPDAVLAEPGQPLLGQPPSPDQNPRTVLVGPEGGFTPDELAGRPLIGLPGHVLRTESAAIAAGVLLVATAARG